MWLVSTYAAVRPIIPLSATTGDRQRRGLFDILASIVAAVFLLAGAQGALGGGLISQLPLAGDLRDTVTGSPADFGRPGEAYTRSGERLPADQPRFEATAVAVAREWSVSLGPDGRAPIAVASGLLFAADKLNRLWASSDGVDFELRSTLNGQVIAGTSAYSTPSGALLVGLWHPHQVPLHRLWRSEDGGRFFSPVLDFPVGGWPAHWNYSTLGDVLFVSEYGSKQGASQHIYRSLDDGRSWHLVFDPGKPLIGFHFHKTLADPWSGVVYTTYGDDPWFGTIYSTDKGLTWADLDRFHLGTSAIPRPDAVYFGSDGWGRNRIERFDWARNRWTHPLRPWFGYTSNASNGQTPTCNVYSMLEHNNVMYAPFAAKANQMWASADGEHWAFCWLGEAGDKGVFALQGELGGWIHGLYDFDPSDAPFPHAYGHLRFRPVIVASLAGLRLEPQVTNLVDSLGSSMEDGLDGMAHSAAARLEWDPTRSFHGSASAKFGNTNLAASQVKLPAALGTFPAGTTVRARVRLLGDAQVLSVRLLDELNQQWGPHTLVAPDIEWTAVDSYMTVIHDNNRVRLVVSGWRDREQNTSVWIDGYEITTGTSGATWHPGGESIPGEWLRAPVTFPLEWTDFVHYQPDWSSAFASGPPLPIKAWVADNGDYAEVALDPRAGTFRLRQVVDGAATTLCETERARMEPAWTCRLGVRNSAQESELRVVIGSKVFRCAGPAIAIRTQELWIGSGPSGAYPAPGLYMLSRTFDSALEDAEFDEELSFLPVTSADINRNGRDELDDYARLFACLNGPTMLLEAACHFSDLSLDGRVDLADFARLQSAYRP